MGRFKDNKTLEKTCEEVLEEDPGSRTDNWRFFTKVLTKLGCNFFINYADFHWLPSPESILKTKRDILNTPKGERLRDNFTLGVGVTIEKQGNRLAGVSHSKK